MINIGIAGTIGGGKSHIIKTIKDLSKFIDPNKYPNLYKAVKGRQITDLVETPNPVRLDNYYDALKTKIGIELSKICFEIQMDFLTGRCKFAVQKKIKSNDVFLEDRTYYEDCIFPILQYKDGILFDEHFATYIELFLGLLKFIPRYDLILFMDVTGESSYKNLRLRGAKNIDMEYVQKLVDIYTVFKDFLKKEYKQKMIIIDNNDHITDEQILDILEEAFK